MSAGAVHLSIVIPAYHEARRILPTLDKIRRYLASQAYQSEVIVVVDGGHDGTFQLVDRLRSSWPALRVLDNGTNRGKGYSVRRGMLEGTGRFLLFSDADLSTPIEEVERVVGALESGADVAIGSRALEASDVRVSQVWWRQAMGRTFNQVVRLMAVSGIGDTQCGFKCFGREAGRRIFDRQRTTGFAFDVELIWIARKLGYRVVEVPVTWVNDVASSVHPVADSIRILVDLVKVRVGDLRGHYPEDDS
jgi:dolichyl-phosphate beta-glucosyltransferase